MFKDLLRYRGFIWRRAVADLRHRYTGTGLGMFWNIISPLMQIAIYAVVFTQLMKVRMGDDSPYRFVIYLCSGLLPWIAFNDCVTRAASSFIDNANYLRKLPIPEQVFAAQTVVSAALSLAISLGLLMVLAPLLGQAPHRLWALVPLVCLLWQAFGFGLGLLLATLNSFIRDIGPIVAVLFQIWMWSLPIVYLADILPAWAQRVMLFNPPYPFLLAIQKLLVFGRFPPTWVWPAMAGWTTAAIAAGFLVLGSLRRELRDVL